ncbi:hypothetical protein GSI_12420 [Ganoderma sinense ZZ0214-1]|uniref:Uncharacterized protein n=1 Tax=Ganoderma sinense ZZ0214-1 TaxID=1077348 RepID=A0A2G8RVI7_9APHY|nr:hypothetical protein GSI_12420 [Ganoderma sinense ZZ0214-1]
MTISTWVQHTGLIFASSYTDSSDPPARPSLILAASSSEWSSAEYPPNTRGFLYYHVSPNGSPLSGELRFRLTSSHDPAGFAIGSDFSLSAVCPGRIHFTRSCGDQITNLTSPPSSARTASSRDGHWTSPPRSAAAASLQASDGGADGSDMLKMTPSTLSAFG